jgi:hypothetical protein
VVGREQRRQNRASCLHLRGKAQGQRGSDQ